MRTLDADFVTEKNKPANQPIYLYIIEDYDGDSNNLCYAAYDTDVVFDGVTYTRFPISHGPVEENSQGQIDTVRVRVANVSRVIQAYLETYNLRGKKVTIRQVWADQLADASAKIDDIYYIDSYTAGEEAAEFLLSSRLDILDVELPGRRYWRTFCAWKFKGTECGYSGGETSCNKTLARCRELNNRLRFGGFPSIPTRRVYGA